MLDFITSLAGSIDNELLLATAFVGLAAAVMATGVPMVLLPISFSSGLMLGGRLGVASMLLGSVIGSQALFFGARRWFAAPIRHRWGHRLEVYDRELAKRGFFYLVGLRLMGTPQLVLSSACALSAVRARTYALATLIGIAPAIILSVTAGAAL